jgi:hypothetical protein
MIPFTGYAELAAENRRSRRQNQEHPRPFAGQVRDHSTPHVAPKHGACHALHLTSVGCFAATLFLFNSACAQQASALDRVQNRKHGAHAGVFPFVFTTEIA